MSYMQLSEGGFQVAATWIVVPVLRSCQILVWIWLVNYLYLHLQTPSHPHIHANCMCNTTCYMEKAT